MTMGGEPPVSELGEHLLRNHAGQMLATLPRVFPRERPERAEAR